VQPTVGDLLSLVKKSLWTTKVNEEEKRNIDINELVVQW
jgi:hypothetical protein